MRQTPYEKLTNQHPSGCNGAITQTSIDGKLHNVPRVQFSFSGYNTVLSKFIK
jgi:hypothetical protein